MLSANTTYYFVPYTTGSYDMALHATTNGDEDPGSQAGWGIENAVHYVRSNQPGGSWTKYAGDSLRIRVNGASVGTPGLTGLSLSVGGNAVTLTGGNPDIPIGRWATVPRDATTLTVTPTWTDIGITATVTSQELASRTVLTAPTAVTSGGSADVALASGSRYISEHRTYVYVELTNTASGRKSGHTVVVTKGGGSLVASLSVSPNPVPEADETLAAGTRATVTVTLDHPLDTDRDQVIPLSVTHGTSDSGDWSVFNSAVTIRRGERSGTTYIQTWPDEDTDDEMLTVALDTTRAGGAAWGNGISADTSASSVTLTITDTGAYQQQTEDTGAGDSSPATESETIVWNPYAALIAQMREWRNDPQWVSHKSHTDRWDRALKAFGETVPDSSLTAMTAAQAQALADKPWGTRWVEVAKALWEIEGARVQPPPPAPDPVVTIAAGNPVTEGAAAGFTLKAAPAPAADLGVSVTVSQSGAVAQAAPRGARTVAVPAGRAAAPVTGATV
ncbi:MAG: hypothetical protein F4Y57_00250, partial [Acidobacteria bacterium]|nr:hypothetical protein [Acidobacteriota bacterium]